MATVAKVDLNEWLAWFGDLWQTKAPPKWLLISASIVYAYYKFATWHFGVFKKMGIKGPKPIPLFGTMLPTMRDGLLAHDLDKRRTYGPVVGGFQGRIPVLIIYDVDMLKQILVKDFSSFEDRFVPIEFEHPLNKMVFTLKGEDWRRVRNTLTPTFTTGKLRRMQKQIERCADCLVANLAQKADSGETFDFCKLCGAFTMDVIASTAFNIQIDSHNDPNNQFVRNAMAFQSDFAKLHVLLFFFFPFLVKPLTKLGFSMFPRKSTRFFLRVVDEAMAQRKSAPPSDDKGLGDFLQLMVNADLLDNDETEEETSANTRRETEGSNKRGLTREEILAQALFFFFAGYETTANTLSFFGYNMATNPDCQDKLVAEIDEVFKTEDTLSYDSLHKMPYLDMCMCETLRLYPAGPRTDRVTVRDTIINGLHIPKGMAIAIPITALHHDPDVWPNPDKFDPDRFLPANRESRNPFYYLPFGQGPRNCIGMRLALQEMKLGMVHILRQFRLVACDETEVPLTLDKLSKKAQNGVKIRVQRR